MIFINNKYTKWYFQIIESARNNPYQGYTEKHHIIPKSIGGTDTADNIIILSGRQHYICHLLLTKMTSGNNRYKMIKAAWMTSHTRTGTKTNSRIYQYLKENISFSKETRQKLSAAKKGKPMKFEHREHLSKKMTGRKLSKSHKNNIKKGLSYLKGVPRDDAVIEKMKKWREENTQEFSDATRKKMRESAKNRPAQTAKTKQKRADAIKQQPKVSCILCKKSCSSHMLNKHQSSKSCVTDYKDRQWYTNGVEEKWLLVSNGIPSGWYKGRCCQNLGRPKS